MPEQKPTVGRIVHYTPGAFVSGDGVCLPAPQAAIVTKVPEPGFAPDGEVDLAVFREDQPWPTRRVPYSESPKMGYWSWPSRA